MCVKLCTVILCVKLHTVYKITHFMFMKEITLCVKLHTVCKIIHRMQEFLHIHCEKFPSVKNFTLGPLLMLIASNMRYAQELSQKNFFFCKYTFGKQTFRNILSQKIHFHKRRRKIHRKYISTENTFSEDTLWDV